MARNWSKQRSRDQASRARRAEIDDARYLADLAAPRYERVAKRGPAMLNCKCGHRGKVDTARHTRFRCRKCGRLWIL